jgi:hypothetical protein
MHLSRTSEIVLISLALACGPQANDASSWAGTYSNRSPGLLTTNDSGVLHFEIREGGSFTIVRSGSSQGEACNNIKGPPSVYSWKTLSDTEIEVSFPDRILGHDAWRISRGPNCSMRVRRVNAGVVSSKATDYPRGEVCLEVPACLEGQVCSGCSLDWCDEPPPPCDEGSNAG